MAENAVPGKGILIFAKSATLGYLPVSLTDTGAININGSISAALGAFVPASQFSLAVSNASGAVAISGGTGVFIRNTGSTDCYLKFGATATTSDLLLKAGEAIQLDSGGGGTLAAITASGTTTLKITTGSGLTVLSQPGGTGGGSGGAATIADGADVAEGSTADAAYVSGSGTMVSLLKGCFGKLGSLVTGTAITNLPVAVDVNSGNKSNSTLRCVSATDSPAVPLWGHGATGAAVPANATYVGMNVGGNLTGLVGTANGLKVDGSAVTQPISAAALPLPSGAATAAKQPALGTAGSASSDVITVQGIASMTALKVDGSAVTQPVSGTVTANAADVTPVLVDALSTTVKGVLASAAGKLMSYYCYNPNASVAYVQIFDVATTGGVTLGTTVPKWSIAIPAGSAANLSQLNFAFANGIQVAATTTAKGSTALGTALDCNFGYR